MVRHAFGTPDHETIVYVTYGEPAVSNQWICNGFKSDGCDVSPPPLSLLGPPRNSMSVRNAYRIWMILMIPTCANSMPINSSDCLGRLLWMQSCRPLAALLPPSCRPPAAHLPLAKSSDCLEDVVVVAIHMLFWLGFCNVFKYRQCCVYCGCFRWVFFIGSERVATHVCSGGGFLICLCACGFRDPMVRIHGVETIVFTIVWETPVAKPLYM